jgi:hypothetical protein
MAARRTGPQQRASERLNVALARIHAAVGLMEAGEGAAATLKKQMEEAIEEAYAALSDIRHALATL